MARSVGAAAADPRLSCERVLALPPRGCTTTGGRREFAINAMGRRKTVRAARDAVSRGQRPTFRVSLRARRVVELPWLEFDGARPAEVAEAARRAIAGELGVRAHEVEVALVPEDTVRRA